MEDSKNSLSRYLARTGISSRRKAVILINAGHVTVNGVVVINPAMRLCAADEVTVNSKLVFAAPKIYILLNKPYGYITTLSDEHGRKTVMDLVPVRKYRLYPVGRLDRQTTGLLLITNDGDLAYRLSHPQYEVNKTYLVTLNAPVKESDFAQIQVGIFLSDGYIKVDKIKRLSNRRIELILHSGRYRIIRRLFVKLGYAVTELDRIIYAGLKKEGLPVGSWRQLIKKEVDQEG